MSSPNENSSRSNEQSGIQETTNEEDKNTQGIDEEKISNENIESIVSEPMNTSSDEDDDIVSIYTLQLELSQYVQKSESMPYHEVYPGAEMIDYDFTAERQILHPTNLVESTSHLMKGCLGAGVLGMHEAYMYGGLWTSLAATVVLGFIISYTMFMLVKSAQKMYVRIRVPRLSYPDLAEAAVATGPLKCCRRYSKAFRYTVDICLFVELCGTCCVYEIMIAHTLKQVLEALSTTIHDWHLTIRMYILIIAIPLLVLCMIRSLKYLAPFSMIADLFIGICVLVTVFYSISTETDINDRPAWKSIHGLFRFCGVCIYSIEGIGVTLPIENNMKTPQYFSIVLQYGMSSVVVCVTIIGFFGYWAWGESCQTPITVHLPIETVPIILEFLLVAMLSVTFSIHFWVPFRIIWHYIGKRHKKKRGIWERFYRAIHVILITCLSMAFPNLNSLMSFLGDFFMAFVGFIFPAFIESMVTWTEHKKGWVRWRFIKNLFIILLGVILCAGAFYSNIG